MATSASPPPASGAPGSAAASKMFLLVAVLLGVLATVLAFFFINNASANNTGPQIWVVVAKHDMSPNLPLDPERDLTRIQIPQRFASLADRCLDWELRASYKGQRINREIFAGQPILRSDLVATSSVLFLDKPYTALTLPAETGMIIPGDYVKIIVSRSNLVGAASTSPVAGVPAYDAAIIGKGDGFKVLAVGGMTSMPRSMTIATNQSSAAKTVTLQVTEAQATEIMGALGTINGSTKAVLLLCPSENTAQPTLPSEDATPATTRSATKP